MSVRTVGWAEEPWPEMPSGSAGSGRDVSSVPWAVRSGPGGAGAAAAADSVSESVSSEVQLSDLQCPVRDPLRRRNVNTLVVFGMVSSAEPALLQHALVSTTIQRTSVDSSWWHCESLGISQHWYSCASERGVTKFSFSLHRHSATGTRPRLQARLGIPP